MPATTFGAPLVQTPPMHVSPAVHALPSLHNEPSGLAGFEQLPVLGSQVPAGWHWSDAVQRTGVPVHTPAWHVSPVVQALPSLQVVPLALAGLEHCPVVGSQVPATWHVSDGKHTVAVPPWQKPLWHVSPTVQTLPSSQARLS